MRVLFDVVHPAHVHFYRYMIADLQARGDDVSVVSRPKDVTTQLLDRLGIEHRALGSGPASSRIGQGYELVTRDIGIGREIARFRPDVVCTRSPAGVQAARLFPGVRGVFDTDDGPAAGLHYHMAARFADVITTPDCLTAEIGAKHCPYPSYKALAYLHPDRYLPDPSIRSELGVDGDEPYSVVRLVAMKASHDHGEAGLHRDDARGIVEELRQHGSVFVSGESALDPDLAKYALPVPPDRMHDVLAEASLYIGDSQTMAIEAALLGVPTIQCSSWSRRLDYLVELEDRYQMLRSFRPSQIREIRECIAAMSSDLVQIKSTWNERRSALLAEKVELSTWYLALIDELA